MKNQEFKKILIFSYLFCKSNWYSDHNDRHASLTLYVLLKIELLNVEIKREKNQMLKVSNA